jgi:hypothetical protein
MDSGNGGIGQMSGEGSQMTEPWPGWDCELLNPRWPGVDRLHISRVMPLDAGNPDGMCAVVVTADARTTREAEAFRDAVLKLARGRLGA